MPGPQKAGEEGEGQGLKVPGNRRQVYTAALQGSALSGLSREAGREHQAARGCPGLGGCHPLGGGAEEGNLLTIFIHLTLQLRCLGGNRQETEA